jgi:hypothetical protein
MRGANILGAVLSQSLPFETVLEEVEVEWMSFQAFEIVDVLLGVPEVILQSYIIRLHWRWRTPVNLQ